MNLWLRWLGACKAHVRLWSWSAAKPEMSLDIQYLALHCFPSIELLLSKPMLSPSVSQGPRFKSSLSSNSSSASRSESAYSSFRMLLGQCRVFAVFARCCPSCLHPKMTRTCENSRSSTVATSQPADVTMIGPWWSMMVHEHTCLTYGMLFFPRRIDSSKWSFPYLSFLWPGSCMEAHGKSCVHGMSLLHLSSLSN